MSNANTFQQTLDRLYEQRSPANLANDPLSFCHRYHDPADREIAALIAAVFAYGNVTVIKGSLEKIFARMEQAPAAFIDRFDPRRQSRRFADFKHRFNDQSDLMALCWAIRLMREQAGSIEAFFGRHYAQAADTVEDSLNRFVTEVFSLDFRPVYGRGGLPEGSSFRFLFPAPAGGSACKRLCMFLRWVVRPADGIDLGLWQSVRPSQLVIPVDRHIERIGRLVGLTSRRTPDWRMALEITAALRRFNPDDPVRYDFSLCHLGISGGCTGSRCPACTTCPIKRFCPASRRIRN